MKIILNKTAKPFSVIHYSKIKKVTLPLSVPKIEALERFAMTCKLYDGIGLSATQVGINQRFFCLKNLNTNDEFQFFFEPTWKFTSNEKIKNQEGCLSVPGFIYEVERYSFIEASYKTLVNEEESGKWVFKQESRQLSGIESIAYQHEWDHLQGISIVQRGRKIIAP